MLEQRKIHESQGCEIACKNARVRGSKMTQRRQFSYLIVTLSASLPTSSYCGLHSLFPKQTPYNGVDASLQAS